MKQSHLFTKTEKKDPSNIKLPGNRYLYRGGFIRESVAGRYYFLPLGMRVHEKISRIIEEEMNAAGAQRMLTPTLHQMELWEETNRTSTTGFELMGVEDRRGAKFALGGTAEEIIVDVVRKFNISYKDLPFNVYQFSNKFRDELRARGGLLRVREFIMKDAYSFHADEKDFKKEYQNMWNTYKCIFERVGLSTDVAAADNGYIAGDYSHEFIVESDAGESRYFVSDDGSYAEHEDVATFDRGAMNSEEELKNMETIKQPQWVQTMEDNIKHYDQPSWRYLKNVVYKNTTNDELIIVTIRGDLNVNKTKLEKKLNLVGQLEDASDEDLKKIGTKTGYVHSWGHDARYIGDLSLKSVRNFIGGQKEDTTDTCNVNYGRDFTCEQLLDVALCYNDARNEDGKELREKKGIEVGNIFQLGTHYSKLMNATFRDADGKEQFYYMGCYGIGVGRTLATIAEKHADDKGLVWPENVAPFRVHVLSLGQDEKAEEIYKELTDKGIDVLLDDRDVRPGEKFADSDLLGMPWRVVVSEKSLAAGGIEAKKRTSDDAQIMSVEEFVKMMDS